VNAAGGWAIEDLRRATLWKAARTMAARQHAVDDPLDFSLIPIYDMTRSVDLVHLVHLVHLVTREPIGK
jgi:hypothetical protein